MTTNIKTLPAGTVVRCPRYQRGQNLGPAKAIILATLGTNPAAGYRVWFYTKGPAVLGDGGTVSLSFPRELTVTGTLADFSERTLRGIVAGAKAFGDAYDVWRDASVEQGRKAAARRA